MFDLLINIIHLSAIVLCEKQNDVNSHSTRTRNGIFKWEIILRETLMN